LLEEARRTLAGDPARALELTRRHQRLYPTSALRQERDWIAIEALVQLGRRDEARARADSFDRVFPGSAHRRDIESLLGFDRGVDNP
jgi:hypothetical protein